MFVVAHPDDEVLGAGAFIKKSIERGDEVNVVILNADYEKTRQEMFSDIIKSHSILGISSRALYSYKNMNFWREDHRDIVETIEKEIRTFKPDYIFTHWDGDIHTDHKVVSLLTQQAARYWQRDTEHKQESCIKGLFFMEVLSSTGWGSSAFKPDTYFEAEESDIDTKIDALSVYKNVLRPMPHPRSPECIESLAILRGSEAGCKYAEGFITCWRKML